MYIGKRYANAVHRARSAASGVSVCWSPTWYGRQQSAYSSPEPQAQAVTEGSAGRRLPKPRTTSSNVFGAGFGAPKPAIAITGECRGVERMVTGWARAIDAMPKAANIAPCRAPNFVKHGEIRAADARRPGPLAPGRGNARASDTEQPVSLQPRSLG
eukprot:scaffold8630_cov115-Isochrysis_galbana.AAC.8